MPDVFIGVGANLGDRLKNIKKAIWHLRREKGIRVKRVSSFIETEPKEGAPPPNFLNGVIKLNTRLSPERLLAVLQKIEQRLGRRRTYKNAPRPIDLDILLYGAKRINTSQLKIPHPRLLKRPFVLGPLLEIEPQIFKKFKKLKCRLPESHGG